MKSSRKHWFAPLKHAALAFFKHDVSLRHQDGRVQLVLQSRDPGGGERVLTRTEQAKMRDERSLCLARSELAGLLDRDAGLRSSLRHLAFVEDALQREGWRGLRSVPNDVLQRALLQFEDLITNWSAEGLACLRSKMAVAATDCEQEPPEVQAEARRLLTELESPQVLTARAIEGARAPAEDDDAAWRAAYDALGIAGVERQAR